MKHHRMILMLATLSGTMAWAQTPPPGPDSPKPAQSSPQAEAGEPRANTSAQAEAGEPRAQTSAPAPAPAKNAPAKVPPAAAARPAAPAQKGGNDRLQLGTATVTGDREQPKVMYIVPWKRSDIGDLEGKPMNSLVDEILSPVDRDVFKREVRYYQTVNSDASQSGAKPPPGQVEK